MIIIKSNSRRTASFSQLIQYINKGRVEGDEFFFKHNVYGTKPYSITKEFLENNKNLKKRKNGVALYHEFISIKYQQGYSKKELREILIDLAEKYTKTRANNCLTYAVIHEQHNQIHLHLMISSNEVESTKTHYFSQAEFEAIKDETREYAYEKYPKLEREEKQEKTKKKANNKARAKDKEIHLKKRTGKQSDREKIKAKLQTIFSLSKTLDEFNKYLRMEGIEIYKRGNTFGFLDTKTNKKYRLKTLELENEFADMSKDFEAVFKASKEKSKNKTNGFEYE